jgi:molecular chaperone DnaJ
LVSKEDLISIKVPAGVADGMQLSMSGKGNEAPGGGIPGDLLILIEEQEDQELRRDGNNIFYDLHISFIDAALGTAVEVPSVGGRVRIKIDAGTQSGKILRLRGKGLRDLNGYGVGDQLIHINVWTPRKLTSEEKAKLESLKLSPNFQPHPESNERSFFDRMKEFIS